MNSKLLIFELDRVRAENVRMKEALAQAIATLTDAINQPVFAGWDKPKPTASCETLKADKKKKAPPQPVQISSRRPAPLNCVDVIEVTLDEIWESGQGDFTIEEIMSKRRSADLAKARHKCMVAVRDARPDMTLTEMARLFNRDHTSISYALRKHDAKVVPLRVAQ